MGDLQNVTSIVRIATVIVGTFLIAGVANDEQKTRQLYIITVRRNGNQQ